MTNIITACFGGTRYANTRPAWLIDHGMVLKIEGVELPETYFVDFANSKAEQATRVLGNADGVVIPDQYFLSNAPQIFAWVYLTTGDSGFTTLQVTIPLSQRPDVSTEPPTPQETDLIEQAIAALNTGVNRAETAAEGAEQSAEEAKEAAENIQQTVEDALQEAKDSGEFDGPAGERGPAGPAGPQGPKGDPGEVTQAEFDELSGDVGDLNSAFELQSEIANKGTYDLHPQIVNGYTINKTTGELVPQGGSTQYVVTDLIPVVAGSKNTVKGQNAPTWSSDAWVTYGEDGEVIIDHGTSTLDTTGAAYFRLANYNENSDHSALAVNYKSEILEEIEEISDTADNAAESALEARAFTANIRDAVYSYEMKNGADFTDVTDYSIFNENSGAIEQSDYFMVLNAYQPVYGNTQYSTWENNATGSWVADTTAKILFYDNLKNFIGIGTKNNGVWTSPVGAAFVRISCRRDLIGKFVFAEGTSAPTINEYPNSTPYDVTKNLRPDMLLGYRSCVRPKITTAYIVDTAIRRQPMPIFCTSANYIYTQNYSAPAYALTFRVSGKQYLYKSVDGGNTWSKIGEITVDESAGEVIQHLYVEPWEETVYVIKYNGNTLETNTLISYSVSNGSLSQIGTLDLETRTAHSSDHNFDSSLDGTGHAYTFFATYGNGTNDTVAEMYVYKTVNRGATWAKQLTKRSRGQTPANSEIRHFHGVQIDPYTSDVWVCAGDTDSECHIYVSKDGGSTWRGFLGNGQHARTLGFVFFSDAIYYGMDSPVASHPSFIYRIDREKFNKLWNNDPTMPDPILTRTIVAECPNGWAVYSLSRTFFPKGFLVFYNFERQNGSAEGAKLPIDFYNLDTGKLETITEFDISSLTEEGYIGFITASRYQDELSGKIFCEANPGLYHSRSGISTTKHARIWDIELMG